MSSVPPDEGEVPSQDKLNRVLFREMQAGHREARRSRRLVRLLLFLAAAYFAAGGYLVDRQNAKTAAVIRDVAAQTARIDAQNDRINEGRKVSHSAVCAFGGAIAEAGRSILDDEATAGRRPRGAGQAYIDNIARRVELQTGIRGLVVQSGARAGTLDCDRLQRAAKIP